MDIQNGHSTFDIVFMKKETTIYDIAASLKLSPATVSRALKDHHAIHPKTKAIVHAKADELKYRSNAFARNLRRKKTDTLGVIVPRLNSNFMSSALAGMERVANEAGYNLLITQSLESVDKELTNTKTMFNSRVDGLLVSVAYDTDDLGHFRKFVEKKIPLVFFDRVTDYPECTHIVIDNFQAGYQATMHLLGQGYRKVLHVTGNQKRNVYRDRHQGYLKALEDSGLAFGGLPEQVLQRQELLRLEGDLSETFGIAMARKVHSMGGERPDALFLDNDLCAASFVKGIMELGYKIPEDIAVVGFNDDPVSRFISPQLTTIRYPGEQMGEIAAQKIIGQIENKADVQGPCILTLPFELIVRGSSLKNQDHLAE